MNKSTRSSTSVLLPRILQKRAADPADRWSYAFLDSQGGEQCRWTAGDLAARTRAIAAHIGDRKSVVEGKSGSVRVDSGVRRIIKKKRTKQDISIQTAYTKPSIGRKM